MKCLIPIFLLAALAIAADKKPKVRPPSPLDRFVGDARARSAEAPPAAPGGIWIARRAPRRCRPRPQSQPDRRRDHRPGRGERFRRRERNHQNRARLKHQEFHQRSRRHHQGAGPWANLAGVNGDTQLAGEGTTTRDVVISTTLTARVSGVLPNGAMLVEATKDVEVNSERQTITVRGIVRPADVASDNTVRSDRLGQLEVRVNGKGVVGDAIRRPFILYRLLLGLLPF